MKFTVIDAEQRSPEWHAARLGRLTGSRAADMLSTRKDKTEAAGRRNLRTQLVLERITGRSQEDPYESPWMKHGSEFEPSALAEFEAVSGLIVRRTGFLSCDDMPVGCSLDGHVGDFEGIIEAKCVKAANHLEYLQRARIPPEYIAQCTHNLWVSGAQWVEFASWNDQFPPELQLFRVRAYREEFARELEEYERAARLFLAEVDRETEAVRALMRKRAA